MKHYTWLLLIPLLLLTTFLAARRLNADAVWFDEYASLYNVGSPPSGSRTLLEIWNANLAINLSEPPGYYLLLGAWGGIVGWTHFASRTLSLLLGLLAVAMTYRLGRDLFSPTVGLGAAVAMGTSAFFIDYLHELRNYTLFVFLMAYVVWAYWRIAYLIPRSRFGRSMMHHAPTTTVFLPLPNAERASGGEVLTKTQNAGLRPSRVTIRTGEVIFVLALTAFMYVHYNAMVAVTALALYHLLFVRKDRDWWRIVLLMGVAGLLYLPWAGNALGGLTKAAGGVNFVIPTLTPTQTGQLMVYTFSNGSVALLALLVGAALASRDRPAGYIWFMAVVMIGGMLLVEARLKILVHIRHTLALWPLLALLVGLGIERLAQGGVHPALPIAVWIAAGIGAALDPAFVRNLPNTEARLDWQGLSATLDTLRARATSDDVVVFHVPVGDSVLGYYMHGLSPTFQRTESFFYSPDPNATYPANASAFMDAAARVWYVTAPEMPPFYQEAEFKGALTAHHALCDVPVDLPGMHLERYARLPDKTGDFQFGEGITLTPLDPIPVSAHENLPLLLGWSLADDVPRETYSVLLHVEDAAGQLLIPADYGLPDESFGCRSSQIALDTLAPGEYTLLVGVYSWQTLERLPAKNLASGEEGDRLLLVRFTIER